MFYLLIDSFFFQIILTTKTFQKRKGSVNECLEINRTATVRSYAAVHGVIYDPLCFYSDKRVTIRQNRPKVSNNLYIRKLGVCPL